MMKALLWLSTEYCEAVVSLVDRPKVPKIVFSNKRLWTVTVLNNCDQGSPLVPFCNTCTTMTVCILASLSSDKGTVSLVKSSSSACGKRRAFHQRQVTFSFFVIVYWCKVVMMVSNLVNRACITTTAWWNQKFVSVIKKKVKREYFLWLENERFNKKKLKKKMYICILERVIYRRVIWVSCPDR